MGRIYRATSSFCVDLDGVKVAVGRGDTIREGHPVLVSHPGLFDLLVPKFEHAPKPPAPAKAPTPTPVKKVAPPPAVKAAIPSPTVTSTSKKVGGDV